MLTIQGLFDYYHSCAYFGEMNMRIRWVPYLAIIIGLGGSALALGQDVNPADLLKTADEMIQVTARLRNLQPKAPIERGIKNRPEISQYLDEQVKENYSESELLREGTTLRLLGVIPASIDYRGFVLKLYSEQIAGFYDGDKKTFFVASWLSAEEQKPVMVHELDHALQDQYFDVMKVLKEDRKRDNSDRSMAHQALFEGDATVIMLNFELAGAKRTFDTLPDLALAMRALLLGMQSQFPVFKSAPPYLQESMFFPYAYGASFLQKAWAKNPSWDFVDKIYKDLPSSTEQILHPDKYFGTRDEPQTVNAEALVPKIGDDWKVVYKNVLGEFSLNLMLNTHLSEERSKRSAAGWGGDQVLLLENGEGKNAVLVNTVWDNPNEAAEFFQSMQVWLQQKYPNAAKSDETDKGYSLQHDNAVESIRCEGANVRFVLGLPASYALQLKAF
jgi:hypothetical protein